MKTFILSTTIALAIIATSGFSSLAGANPIDPYSPKPVCKSGFVPTQLPDGTWRCLPRYR